MFGESDSESPRIPSPWDSLISTPPATTPPMGRARNPSPLAIELVPKLVPESDDGNVEYKLQLLNPSPSRFARLVTQLKWRLLEGGGQAYYELGVADSGDLIGLSRDEIEKSLETLEMMAGEIGASVIVVKEIEVPAGLAKLVRSRKTSDQHGTPSSFSSIDGDFSSNTSVDTETDPDSLSDTDGDECLEKTVVLSKGFINDEISGLMFTMDSETEETSNATEEEGPAYLPPQFNLEISSVFKPRPIKPRGLNPLHGTYLFGGKNKHNKKVKQTDAVQSMKQHSKTSSAQRMDKAIQRRQNRDKRRDEKRKGLEAQVGLDVVVPSQTAVDAVPSSPERDALVDGLKMLHVSVMEDQSIKDSDVDVLSDLLSAKSVLPSLPTFTTSESHLDVDPVAIANAVGDTSLDGEINRKTLIVEALVVRKMLHQEAFLDFEGFSVL